MADSSSSGGLIDIEKWYWSYNAVADRLYITVCNASGFFCGATWYSKALCNQEALTGRVSFTAKDRDNYLTIKNCLNDFSLSEDDKAIMALNATTMARFHRNHLLSDDYFMKGGKKVNLSVGEVVLMVPKFLNNNKRAETNFIVIDTDEDSCYLMLISKPAMLDSVQQINVGSIIRVSNTVPIPMRCINTKLIQTLNIA